MEIENRLERQPQQHHEESLNEWGEYVGNKDCIFTHSPGVIEAIQNNNPAITSISVRYGGDFTNRTAYNEFWESAGQCLVNSKHVKHLYIDNVSRAGMEAFSRGLNLNRSIEMLTVYANRQLDLSVFLPFFANNTQLMSIDIDCNRDWDELTNENIAGIRKALQACQSLKSIRITFGDDVNFASDIIDVICKLKGLNHLFLDCCYLTDKFCLLVSQMLSDKNCQLKSFVFREGEWCKSNHNLAIIGMGLCRNQSIECLRIKISDNRAKYYVKAFFDSFSNARLKGMPMLTSLCLERSNLDSLTWKTLVSYVTSSNSLQKLSFSLSVDAMIAENDDTFQQFVNWFENSSTLKVLDTTGSNPFTGAAWCKLFSSNQTSMLEEMAVQVDTRNNLLMTALSKLMDSNQKLRVLKIWDDDKHEAEGWHEIFTALRSHKSIEEFDADFPDDSLTDFANVLRMNSSLKRLQLVIFGTVHLQLTLDAIADPCCSIEELELNYFDDIYENYDDLDELRQLRQQLTEMLVSSLRRNTSVKMLDFNHEDRHEEADIDSDFEFFWSSFTHLLFDESSINATYDSNHVLQSIKLNFEPYRDDVPVELYSLLHLNQNPDKRAVARKKILQTHSLANAEFVTSALPKVMSCIGNIESQLNLSQLYGIIRTFPNLIQKEQMKRKFHEL